MTITNVSKLNRMEIYTKLHELKSLKKEHQKYTTNTKVFQQGTCVAKVNWWNDHVAVWAFNTWMKLHK